MKSERKETVFLFPVHQYEALTRDLPEEDRAMTALQDRDALHCLGKLHLWFGVASGHWAFRVAREVPDGHRDVRDFPTNRQSVLSVYQQPDRPNVAYVEDFSNGMLEGWGVNQWLIYRARESFLKVSGPDPWISGRLIQNDRHNPRRVPFWERQIGAEVYIDKAGNGHFMAPWHNAFNRYRMKLAVVPARGRGEMPENHCSQLAAITLAEKLAISPTRMSFAHR